MLHVLPLVLVRVTQVITVLLEVRAQRVPRTQALRVKDVLQRQRVYATLAITVQMEVRAPRAPYRRTLAFHALAYIQDLEQ